MGSPSLLFSVSFLPKSLVLDAAEFDLAPGSLAGNFWPNLAESHCGQVFPSHFQPPT
jgi:hypothetical protein